MALVEFALELLGEVFFLGGGSTPRATLAWMLVVAVPVGLYLWGPSSLWATLPLSYLAYRLHRWAT